MDTNKDQHYSGAKAYFPDELSHMDVLGHSTAFPRRSLGPWIIEASFPSSLYTGQANLAWRTGVGDYLWAMNTQWPKEADPVQMGRLKFLPAKRALSPSSSSILRESYDHFRLRNRGIHLGFVEVFGKASPQELVVLGQTLGSARSASLDLQEV